MTRISRFLAGAWFAVATVVGPSSAEAASIVARDVPYLIDASDLVVRGVVTAQRVVVDGEGAPHTVTRVAVKAGWKGETPRDVEVWQLGGRLPDGSVLTVPGDLHLDVGDDVVLFLTAGDGGRWFSTLLGWSAFEVQHGPLTTVRRSGDLTSAHVLDAEGRWRKASKAEVRGPTTLADLVAQLDASREVTP